jgi:hypothetical protein
LFVTELGGPTTPATARKLIARAGELAKLPFPHPSAYAATHSAGYKLANDGHDTRSIQQICRASLPDHLGSYAAEPLCDTALSNVTPAKVSLATRNRKADDEGSKSGEDK